MPQRLRPFPSSFPLGPIATTLPRCLFSTEVTVASVEVAARNYVAGRYVADRKIQSRYRRRRVTAAGQTADSFRNLRHVSRIGTRRQLGIKESY